MHSAIWGDRVLNTYAVLDCRVRCETMKLSVRLLFTLAVVVGMSISASAQDPQLMSVLTVSHQDTNELPAPELDQMPPALPTVDRATPVQEPIPLADPFAPEAVPNYPAADTGRIVCPQDNSTTMNFHSNPGAMSYPPPAPTVHYRHSTGANHPQGAYSPVIVPATQPSQPMSIPITAPNNAMMPASIAQPHQVFDNSNRRELKYPFKLSRWLDLRGRRSKFKGLDGLFQGGGPMYAFFDFSAVFSDSESRFSNGVAGTQTGVPFGHKEAFSFGAGLGRYLSKDLRVDVSARNRYIELENQLPGAMGNAFHADGGSDVWTGMFNARHNLPGFHPCIKPYMSAGVGLAYHRAQASTILVGPAVVGPFQSHLNEESTEFAWSVGGGVAFKMTKKMFFDFDYQYIHLGDAATGVSTGGSSILFDELRAHEVAFRLRFNF